MKHKERRQRKKPEVNGRREERVEKHRRINRQIACAILGVEGCFVNQTKHT